MTVSSIKWRRYHWANAAYPQSRAASSPAQPKTLTEDRSNSGDLTSEGQKVLD